MKVYGFYSEDLSDKDMPYGLEISLDIEGNEILEVLWFATDCGREYYAKANNLNLIFN